MQFRFPGWELEVGAGSGSGGDEARSNSERDAGAAAQLVDDLEVRWTAVILWVHYSHSRGWVLE